MQLKKNTYTVDFYGNICKIINLLSLSAYLVKNCFKLNTSFVLTELPVSFIKNIFLPFYFAQLIIP